MGVSRDCAVVIKMVPPHQNACGIVRLRRRRGPSALGRYGRRRCTGTGCPEEWHSSPTRPASLGGLTGARLPSREALMETGSIGPDMRKSDLIIVDIQNDFLHRD